MKEAMLKQLLDTLRTRKSARYGIRTADAYLAGLEACAGDSQCARKFFGLATPEQWTVVLKEAAGRLVYSDDETLVLKSAKPSDLTLKSVLDFECVVTSTKQDRDGDVLESEGANLDPKAPLLWQHIPFEPIGRTVAKGEHSKTVLKASLAIADTILGNDAATLVEFGALRISHGFRPLEFEPLEKGSDHGFRVHKFEIVEVSLVSIPSNTDAEITAFSRGKLHHPLTKSHAAKLWQAKPARVVSGYSLKEQIADFAYELTAPTLSELKQAKQELYPEKSGCSCGNGSHTRAKEGTEQPAKKSLGGALGGPLEGSWEETYCTLDLTVAGYLAEKGIKLDPDNSYCCIHAMFDGFALIRVTQYPSAGPGEAKRTMYKLGWAVANDKPTWVGDPTEVKLRVEIEEVEKRFMNRMFKRANTLEAKSLSSDTLALVLANQINAHRDVSEWAASNLKQALVACEERNERKSVAAVLGL